MAKTPWNYAVIMRLCLKLRFFFYRKKKQKGSSAAKDFALCGERQRLCLLKPQFFEKN
jgi:hypothetical protein